MAGTIFTVIGSWAAAWGVYTIFVSRDPRRRMVAALTAPTGLIMVIIGLLAFMVPGFII
jgi:uncharacterized membrane protein HdeD (DUF308 family)